MNEKLNQCPFCGGEAAIFNSGPRTTGHGESSDTIGVVCKRCDARIGIGHYANYDHPGRTAEAIQRWNRRVN